MSVRRFPRSASRPLSVMAEPLLDGRARSAVLVWVEDGTGDVVHSMLLAEGEDTDRIAGRLARLVVVVLGSGECEEVECGDDA